MAIYHLNVKIISRAKGQSSVGSVAYRRATQMFDARQGRHFDYSKKNNVIHSEICIPKDAPDWLKDITALQGSEPSQASEKFWNLVEHTEKRLDSELAREIEFSLPVELNQEQSIRLAREFIQEQFLPLGMVADFSIHWEKGNPHVHLLLSTRTLTATGFHPKKEREWRSKELLLDWRKSWSEQANRVLAQEGFNTRIDHRSYADQGIDLIPTQHQGPSTYLGQRRIDTRLMELNDNIRASNLKKIQAEPEILLDKIAAEQSFFDFGVVVKAVLRHSNQDKLSNTSPAWQGSSEDIQKLFAAIAQHDSVFSERTLIRALKQYALNEQLSDALLKIRASPNLLAIGPGEDGRERYTTRALFDLENGLQTLADRLHKRSHHVVKNRLIRKTIKEYGLSDDQARAIQHVLKSSDIAAIVGRAGTGKSYSLKAAAYAWQRSGFRVQGIALAGIAAQNLHSDSGIPSKTIASFCLALEEKRLVLNSKDIIVMDEAGMTDSQSFRDVLMAVEKVGAKLVLVGDHAQLQPVGPGAPFRALLERIGFAELTTIRRQSQAWQREATAKLACGDVEMALEDYHRQGCVELLETPEKTMEKLIADWHHSLKAEGTSLEQVLILAYRNLEVDALNRLAREKLIQEGHLDPGISLHSAKGQISVAVGDRLIFLQNQEKLGVRNGSRGTVTEMKGDTLTVKLDGKEEKCISFAPKDYDQFTHGYASTVHRAQGLTVNKAFVLAAGHWVRNLSYVAMSRHRKSVKVYADLIAHPSLDALKKMMSREGLKDSVLDYPLAFAARRGIDPECIEARCKAYVLDKLKNLTQKLRDKFEQLLEPEKYTLRKEQELKREKIQAETVNRRANAKRVADYVAAKQAVGKAWRSLSKSQAQSSNGNKNSSTQKNVDLGPDHPARKAFQQALAERDRLAAHISSESERYSKLLENQNVVLEKLKKQGNFHHARQRISAYLDAFKAGNILQRDQIANEIQEDFKIHYPFLIEKKLSLPQLKSQAISHQKRAAARTVAETQKENLQKIEDYLSFSKKRDQLPAPWTQGSRAQKTEWHDLNRKAETLAYEISKDPKLVAEAFKKGIYPEIKQRASYYQHQLNQSQRKSKVIEL